MGVALAVAVLVVLSGGAVGVTWLCWTAWKRRHQLSLPLKIVASVAAALVICGALGVASGLIMAFGAVGGEAIDPSQKARIFAEGISRVMTCLALALVIGIPSAVALGVVLKKRKAE